jgi:hypothetical protein
VGKLPTSHDETSWGRSLALPVTERKALGVCHASVLVPRWAWPTCVVHVIGDQQPASSSSVMSKTLSNGTLGLRFMQNAQRSKSASEGKPEKGGLADDTEWHVPQNVRDTWTSAGAAATNSSL